jgi:hypothetical protein
MSAVAESARKTVPSYSAQELFVLIAPALTVFAMTAFSDRLIRDGDTYWHIRVGEWMLDNRSIIRSDTFSYTFAGQPWQAHEWLSEVIMALTYRAGGWSALYILTAASFAATAWILARALLKHLEPIPALYISLLAIACLQPWIIIRPHALVMPILALWVSELLRARLDGRSPSVWLAALAMVWANLHGSFVLGIALAGFFAIEAVLDDRRAVLPWGRILGLTIASTLVTPWGVSGLVFPLLFSGNATTDLIVEWQSTTFETLTAFEVSGLALGLLFLLTGVQVPLWRAILLLGLVHMALEHQRFVTVLAIIGSMLIAEPVSNALKQRGWVLDTKRPVNSRGPVIGAAAVALLVVVACFAIPKPMRNNVVTPITALASVPESIGGTPVFNDWTFGGILIFAGVKPFVDGRAEMYGYDFVADYVKIRGGDAAALNSAVERYNIAWAILRPTTSPNNVLDLMPEWCRTFADEFAVVHIRRKIALDSELQCLN